MNNKIVVCIPNYNGEEFLRKLKLLDGVDYLVMDNFSTDNSVQVCKDRGISVVENDVNVNRVENWIRCINYFATSKYKWMKWLFIGDELEDNADIMMNNSINCDSDDVALIIYNYKIIEKKGNVTDWKSLLGYGKFEYDDVCKGLISKGNIFGSPISTMISKKAVGEIISSHKMKWAADELIAYELAKKGKVVFEDEFIGYFNCACRKNYTVELNNLNSILEEMEMVRLVAYENFNIYKENETNVLKYLDAKCMQIIKRDGVILRLKNKLIDSIKK